MRHHLFIFTTTSSTAISKIAFRIPLLAQASRLLQLYVLSLLSQVAIVSTGNISKAKVGKQTNVRNLVIDKKGKAM